jgi:flagellar hook-associated protein 3 FlgL
MRISTAFFFSSNTAALQSKQADLYQSQQQLATGRRIVTPSDDPIGATNALRTSQALAMSENNLANIRTARVMVQGESTTLEAIRNTLISAQSVALGAGDSPSMQERADFAGFLQQIYKDMLGYANGIDTNGNYMFAGYKGGTVPFQQTSGASNYQGDNGQQNVSISNGRQIAVNDPGQTVFGVGTANDPFAVIDQFITDLQNTSLTEAAFDAAVNTALTGLSNALDNVVNIADQVGIRFQELKRAEDVEINYSTQFENELSRLESVDIQKVAVELQLQQISLQASQQAFANVSNMILFNYL